MTYYLAVLFFCAGTECYFWKSNELFFKLEDCTKELDKAGKAFERAGNPSVGNCLQINTKNSV